MKEFFEEYGKVIVTVLIILGIILVGYTIAGNGENSAFGRFTTATVDSLDSQTNRTIDVINNDKAKLIEDSAKFSGGVQSNKYTGGTASMKQKEKGNGFDVSVVGKSDGYSFYDNYAVTKTQAPEKIPFGKTSVLSFDVDGQGEITIDFVSSAGLTEDDYGDGSVYLDGKEIKVNGIQNEWKTASVKLPGGSHHIVVTASNNNPKNTKKADMSVNHIIGYVNESGTSAYKIRNIRYGIR